MKKIFISTSILIFLLITSGCSHNSNTASSKQDPINKAETTKSQQDLRLVAWDTLSDELKSEIIGTWKDAKVTKVTADASHFNLIDKSFENKEVTLVAFTSKNKVLGDIGTLIDEETGKVVGGVYRE